MEVEPVIASAIFGKEARRELRPFLPLSRFYRKPLRSSDVIPKRYRICKVRCYVLLLSWDSVIEYVNRKQWLFAVGHELTLQVQIQVQVQEPTSNCMSQMRFSFLTRRSQSRSRRQDADFNSYILWNAVPSIVHSGATFSTALPQSERNVKRSREKKCRWNMSTATVLCIVHVFRYLRCQIPWTLNYCC